MSCHSSSFYSLTNVGPCYDFNARYSDDPLWDGAGCGDSSTCCQFNNPPSSLPQATTDDVEAASVMEKVYQMRTLLSI